MKDRILDNSPVIGVFDSGLGGLTVVRQLLMNCPSIRLVYFGDTARFPYGNKGRETIERYAIENTQFLLDKGATAVIVACNTATALALPVICSVELRGHKPRSNG